MQHFPHENRVLGADPLQNPALMLAGRPPEGPKSGFSRGGENRENRLPTLLGRSWVALGANFRQDAPTWANLGRCWADFGSISGPTWNHIGLTSGPL